MIKISKASQCCGCTACEAICPKNCIMLVSDEEGFAYPQIDIKKCIGCNACESVCPIIKSESIEQKENVLATYVGYAINEKVRIESSSGGVFSLIANYILEQRGIVFGAAYDEQFCVRHIAIEKKEELFRLRGSKYSQSTITGVYLKVREELAKGRMVLFSGTACQVSGLKNYLKKDYENLITVDILCHGVPSPEVWKRYINELEIVNGELTYINLRDKTKGWYNYSSKFCFKSGKIIEHTHFVDSYMRLFLGDICLRPSCYDCQFKNMNRSSDITVGDCWGIDKLMPEFDDDKGTSVIIIHSLKGKRVSEKISSNMRYKVVDLDVVVPRSENSRKSVEVHVNRKKFFRGFVSGESINKLLGYLNETIFDKIRKKVRKVLNRKMAWFCRGNK